MRPSSRSAASHASARRPHGEGLLRARDVPHRAVSEVQQVPHRRAGALPLVRVHHRELRGVGVDHDHLDVRRQREGGGVEQVHLHDQHDRVDRQLVEAGERALDVVLRGRVERNERDRVARTGRRVGDGVQSPDISGAGEPHGDDAYGSKLTLLRARAALLGRYPSSFIASRTLFRVASTTAASPLETRDTVCDETPASWATSAMETRRGPVRAPCGRRSRPPPADRSRSARSPESLSFAATSCLTPLSGNVTITLPMIT